MTSKKPWIRPTLRRLQKTDDLLELLASISQDKADMPVKRVK